MDFSKFSCSSYINIISRTPATSDAGKSINTLHTWLYGYVSGKFGNPIMSQQQARSFIQNLVPECTTHPNKSVLEASETAYDKARTV